MNPALQGVEQRRQRAEDRVANLPGLSPYVVQLLSTDPRSDAFPARVQAVVEHRRSLASHVLALANSTEANATVSQYLTSGFCSKYLITPIRARMMLTIQNRTIIFGSGHPFNSK